MARLDELEARVEAQKKALKDARKAVAAERRKVKAAEEKAAKLAREKELLEKGKAYEELAAWMESRKLNDGRTIRAWLTEGGAPFWAPPKSSKAES